MRKLPTYLWVGPDSAPLELGSRWGFSATLVLGRQFCVHFSLDATGVPARQTGGFVHLQSARQVPYARFEGVYLRQRDKVHVWVWPQELTAKARTQLKLDQATLTVLPESLWGAVPETGTVLQPCVAGFEALRFEQGQLLRAQWWPNEPTAAEVATLGNLGASQSGRPTRERVQSGRRWARNPRAVVPEGASTPNVGVLSWLRSPMAWVAAGWAAVAVAAGLAGWFWQEGHELSQQKLQAQAQLDGLLQQGPRAAAVSTRSVAADDVQWVHDVRQLTQGVRLDRLLAQLARPLASKGLLIRELVIERDDIKIMLVSGYGGPVDLDEAIGALESASRWERLELLDTSNPAQVRFGLKARAEGAAGGSP